MLRQETYDKEEANLLWLSAGHWRQEWLV